MLLKDLITDIKCEVIGDLSVSITSLTIDSRKCEKGSLYFAINGTTVDGHRFVGSAIENGAVAVVVEHKVDCDIPQIIVESTRSAMSYIASTFYGSPHKKVKLIGITGTNGKTSISFMVRSIANASGYSCGVIGTGGIYLDSKRLDIKFLTSTTPDPIELQYTIGELVRLGARLIVMEVTAHALDLCKTDGMFFESAGFTNLTEDHLDYFITMESYGNAKRRLFDEKRSRLAVLNIDDAFGRELASEVKNRITYSVNGNGDLNADNIEIHETYSLMRLGYKGSFYSVRLNTTGMFNISNALCAIGCCLNAGMCINSCIRGIEGFTSVPGRFEAVPTNGKGITAIVDYAHTPDGLENVLKAINGFKKGKLICVFGCGGNRDAKKRPIMGKIAGELCDYCIITSDNPRFEEPEAIIDEIENGIRETDCKYTRISDRKTAIKLALEAAEAGDVIAICGKGDEDYQEIKGVKHHFSDREAIAEFV